jgi:integrase/recombinase XerD
MPSRRAHDELTKSDVKKLLEASAAVGDEDHLFLLLLARTGRRIGELLALTVRDIDYDGRFITTSIEKRRKAQRRKMFVDDATLGQLRTYIAKHHLANSDRIFPRCMRVYQRLPMKYAAKAGIDKYFTCHSFRHYFITYLIKSGWSYDAIAKLTGHMSVTSLHTYDHAQIEVVEDRFRDVMRNM